MSSLIWFVNVNSHHKEMAHSVESRLGRPFHRALITKSPSQIMLVTKLQTWC